MSEEKSLEAIRQDAKTFEDNLNGLSAEMLKDVPQEETADKDKVEGREDVKTFEDNLNGLSAEIIASVKTGESADTEGVNVERDVIQDLARDLDQERFSSNG